MQAAAACSSRVPGIPGTQLRRRGARIRQKVFAIQGSALFSSFNSAPFRRGAA